MKKLMWKLLLCLLPAVLYLMLSWYLDPFNVFHWNRLRFTDTAPAQNYIKTKYILANREKYNAFVFGSSRVGNLPLDGLPAEDDGIPLAWYNMTSSNAALMDHVKTLQTFLEHQVSVKMLLVGVDEIAATRTYASNAAEPIYRQYQEYEAHPLSFYRSYLLLKPRWSLLPQVLQDDTKAHEEERELFYRYGVRPENCDVTKPELTGQAMPSALPSGRYEAGTDPESIRALQELVRLCRENRIRLVVFSSPILQTTYEEALQNGYADFLKDVGEIVPYYCFSGLNSYTTHAEYYFDNSHYKPYVGLQMEKVMFGGGKVEENFGERKGREEIPLR